MASTYIKDIQSLISSHTVFPIEELKSKDVLKNISSLMYEFKDSSVEVPYNSDSESEGGYYTKSISPLFYDKVINHEGNLEILDVVGSMVPYYYLEPENSISSADDVILQETRDLGIKDVPSPLQNNDFYSTWFRESWGFIQNSLILNAYNELKYPFINENQYLNVSLFPSIYESLFNTSSESDSESYIGFMDSKEENDAVYDSDYEYYGEETGCLDFLDEIVNEKILSSYAIIDYVNKQNVLINKWGESLYESGQLNSEEVDTSKTVFKLQDIKNELLRRKFAGSRTLYDLVTASINRLGSFVTSIKYYDLPTKTIKKDETYHNKRVIRVLKLPGIISQPYDYSNNLGLDLIRTYLETESIPINTAIPLFYTSADINKSTDSTVKYMSEYFFSGQSPYPDNIKKTYSYSGDLTDYQNLFLRDNSNVIDWSSLDGIILSSNVNERFETLDKILSYSEEGKPLYRTMDSEYQEYDEEEAEKYINYTYRDYSTKMRLDISFKILDLDLVSGGVSDVNADKVLYHYNSLQELMGKDYPYVTYPIANNNGPSLIDTYWLDYVEKECRSKSKVQDNTEIGTQVNTIMKMANKGDDPLETGESYFFGISFTDDDSCSWSSLKIRDYKEGDKFALLWYCVIKYNTKSGKVLDLEKTLFSKISLRLLGESYNSDTLKEVLGTLDSKFKESEEEDAGIKEEYEDFLYLNMGVLPLTYSNAVDDTLWGNKIGFYKSSESDTYDEFYNDNSSLGFSNAYFLFSDSNLTKGSPLINQNIVTRNSISRRIESDNSDIKDIFSFVPSTSTRTVYFAVNKPTIDKSLKINEETGTVEYDDEGNAIIESQLTDHYYWSDPISVVPLTDSKITDLKDSYFNPEWRDLGYFFNAYLNFTKNSASPLRNKFVVPSEDFSDLDVNLQKDIVGGSDNLKYDKDGNLQYIINSGDYTALSNLNRTRGMDYVCSDKGEFPTAWLSDLDDSHPSKKIEGMYMKRIHPSIGDVFITNTNREYSSIYGDNRFKDAFDYLYSSTITKTGIGSLSELPHPPATEEDKKALYIVTFKGDLSTYRYYVWNSADAEYRELTSLITAERSKVYLDDNNFKGLHFSSENYLELSEGEYKPYERTPDDPKNNIYWYENYLVMEPSQTSSSWYWNEEPTLEKFKGKSLFFNIRVDEPSILSTPPKTPGFVLFCSKDSDGKEIMKLEATSEGKFKFSILGDSFDTKYLESDVVLTEDSISFNNFRIGASLVGESRKFKMHLLVNELEYTSEEIEVTLNNTSSISLFSIYNEGDNSTPWTQTGMFYGTVYDMRLYNCGKTLPEMRVLNQGSIRELFSYSPSNYKLANTLYRDSAVLKKVYIKTSTSDTSKLPYISSIRIFDRSIWDSIMVDNCALSTEEKSMGSPQYREDFNNPVSDTDVYKPIKDDEGKITGYALNNCVEQDLLEDIEVYNGLSSNITDESELTIYYQSAAKKKNIQFNKNYYTTIVTALIEPESYENDSLESSNISFELNTDGDTKYLSQYISNEDPVGYPIYVPVQSDLSDDYFNYSADIDFNFKLKSDFDISKWLSKGSNVTLEYNYSLDKPVARLSDVSVRDSEKNHIVLPLMLPEEDSDTTSSNTFYLDRFYAKDVVLNNALSAFLNVSSYYNEIQVPVAVKVSEIEYLKFEGYTFNTTTDKTPQSGTTYFYLTDTSKTLTIDNALKFQLATRSDYNGTNIYSLDKDYHIVYPYDESYVESKTIEVSSDGSTWVTLDEDNDPHFYDGYSYRYKINDEEDEEDRPYISYVYADDEWKPSKILEVTEGSMYSAYTPYGSTDTEYSLCLYKYDITSNYYGVHEEYSAIESTGSLESGKVYYDDNYEEVDTDSFKKLDGIYKNTIFNSEYVYYEDHLTENYYYCLQDEEYVFTNVAHPSVETFTEWYKGKYGTLYTQSNVPTCQYYNKWDALRIMKEGTYYFTCKYPMQILPFADDVFDASSDFNYTTYYASCRFKVVVKGTPKDFEDKKQVEGYPQKYWRSNLESTLKLPSQRYLDDDNRTFPHREIDIDLYVMDVEGIAGIMDGDSEDYSFKWTKVASNYDESVKILDRETVEKQVTLSSEIPFFLEKNYVAPFFVAKYDKSDGSEDPESADDDIIDPIKISSTSSEEHIVSSSEGDMDNQVVISGRSYKVLFDYTGKVTELSFTDKYYEDSEELSDSEKTNYARLVNLLDSTTLNVGEYVYNTDGQSYKKSNVNVFYYNSGFKTSGSGWEGIGTYDNEGTGKIEYFFGNPYSRSSELNYILQIRDSALDTVSSLKRVNSRQNINNSFAFPYLVENNKSNTTIPAFLNKIGTVVDSNGIYKDLDFDELGIVKSHYQDIKGKMDGVISSLRTQSCGLFLGMSTFTPNFVGTYSSLNDYEKINNDNFDLFGYFASSRSLKVRNNNVYLTRRNLYSNNLLSNNAFENGSDWVIYGAADTSYVSDDSWDNGKDVFRIVPTNSEENPGEVTLKYSTGDMAIKALYEVAINVLGDNVSSIEVIFYKGNVSAGTLNLSKGSEAVYSSWYTWSAETSEAVEIDSLSFTIKSSSSFDITKAVVRKCNVVSQYLGLANVLNEVTSSSSGSKIISTGHTMVVYRNKTSKELFPVQFNNEVITTTSVNGVQVKRPKSGLSRSSEFITNNNLGTYGEDSKLIKLMSPWIRRIIYYSDESSTDRVCDVHKYSLRSDYMGKREMYEVSSNIKDVLDSSINKGASITSTITSSRTKYQVVIDNLPIKLNNNNCLELYGMNLPLDEDDPVRISNERFSSLFNCLYPNRYREEQDYPVAVTNIQLLEDNGSESPFSYKKNNVVYELEYLPIIYSEKKNHLSLNLLLYKGNDGTE